MSSIEELERRMTALEAELVTVRQEAAAARALAAGADQDVADYRAEMRGQTRVINALRDTQIEHSRRLADYGRTLADHGEALSRIENGLGGITSMLTTLIERDGDSA